MKILKFLLFFALTLVSCATTPVPAPPESAFQTINIFFNKNPENCGEVSPIPRKVPKINDIEALALKTLFKGPIEEEKQEGLFSPFSEKTSDLLISFHSMNGTAYINLKDFRSVIPNVVASCGSMEFLAEMDSTIKQFGTYTKTLYSIEGNKEEFYNFLQRDLPNTEN